MSNQQVVESAGLDKKDKGQLGAIIHALGGQSNQRQTKAELIAEIERLTSEDRVELTDPDDNQDDSHSVNDRGVGRQGVEGNERKVKGRSRGRSRDRQEAGLDPVSDVPIDVSGFLDLRDEGYGFLRVNGFMPSRDDVYVSVKQVRQYGLRRGDHLEGLAAPAHRNEKNPCFSEITAVNGSRAADVVGRPEFSELKPTMPTQQIVFEDENDPENYFLRWVDIFSPIAKGQRNFILGEPATGKTTALMNLAKAVEKNHPDLTPIVLSVGARPEVASLIDDSLDSIEVVAAPMGRPLEEQVATAELTMERAKRLAELGQDVVIFCESLTGYVQALWAHLAENSRSNSSLGAVVVQRVADLVSSAVNLDGAGSITLIAIIDFGVAAEVTDITPALMQQANSLTFLTRCDSFVPGFSFEHSRTSNSRLIMDEELDLKAIEEIRHKVEAAYDPARRTCPVDYVIEAMSGTKSNKEFLAKPEKTDEILGAGGFL